MKCATNSQVFAHPVKLCIEMHTYVFYTGLCRVKIYLNMRFSHSWSSPFMLLETPNNEHDDLIKTMHFWCCSQSLLVITISLLFKHIY